MPRRNQRYLPGAHPGSLSLDDLKSGDFSGGPIGIQWNLPYLELSNQDTISHSFTLTILSAGGAQEFTANLNLPPGGLTAVPTSPFTTIAIDTPTSLVTWFYSDLPLNGPANAIINLGSSEQVVFEVLDPGSTTLVFTCPSGFSAVPLRANFTGVIGQTITVDVYYPPTSIVDYIAIDYALPGPGGIATMGYGLANGIVMTTPVTLLPGDALRVTNNSASDAIAVAVEMWLTPLG